METFGGVKFRGIVLATALFLTFNAGVAGTAAGQEKPRATPGTAPAPPGREGKIVAVYAVQAGAFAVRENADKLVSLLKSKGLNAVIHENLIDGRHLLHLVWVGRFDRAEDAIAEIARIEELTGIRGVLREQMIWRKNR